MLPILAVLLSFVLMLMPSAGFAQPSEILPVSRWNFTPYVSNCGPSVTTRILEGLRHDNKFGDNRSNLEIVLDYQRKKRQESKTRPKQIEPVVVTAPVKASPLEAFKAAFGKPIKNPPHGSHNSRKAHTYAREDLTRIAGKVFEAAVNGTGRTYRGLVSG